MKKCLLSILLATVLLCACAQQTDNTLQTPESSTLVELTVATEETAIRHLRRLPRKARHLRLHRLLNRLPHRRQLKFPYRSLLQRLPKRRLRNPLPRRVSLHRSA